MRSNQWPLPPPEANQVRSTISCQILPRKANRLLLLLLLLRRWRNDASRVSRKICILARPNQHKAIGAQLAT